MDAYCEYNGDLVITPNGSIAVAVEWDQIRERIIRRFLTNSATPLPDGSVTPPDYIFDVFYGIGAGALIDQNPNQSYRRDLTRRMRQAVLLDTAVDPGAVPTIKITRPRIDAIQVFVTVKLSIGGTKSLSLTLGPPQQPVTPAEQSIAASP
jgi:hypothetical protein